MMKRSVSDEILAMALPWEEWTTVCYEPMARSIKDRLLTEQPACKASVGLTDGDEWIIWYRPDLCTWNQDIAG